MSTPLDEQTERKSTPWTTVSDQDVKQQKMTQSKSQKDDLQEWKKLRVLPYLFTASTFLLIFLFSSQFENLGADLFSSSEGENIRFGMKITEDPLENTGALVESNEAQTGAVIETEELWTESPIVKSNVIITPQTVQIVPLQNNANIIPENLHTAAPTQVVPINTNITNNSSNSFRINSHTYDKVTQTQIPENLQQLQLENLHTAAPITQTHTTPQPKQNVQSWPEENAVILISLILSSLAWFGMRKLRA